MYTLRILPYLYHYSLAHHSLSYFNNEYNCKVIFYGLINRDDAMVE